MIGAEDDRPGLCRHVSKDGEWYCDLPAGHGGPIHGVDVESSHLRYWPNEEQPTLRDRFAMRALASPNIGGGSYAGVAKEAYGLADAMLAERGRAAREARERDNAATAGARGHAAGIAYARHCKASPGADGFDDDAAAMAAYCDDEGAIMDDAMESAVESGDYGPSGDPRDDNGGLREGTDEYVSAFVRGVQETIAAYLAEKEAS